MPVFGPVGVSDLSSFMGDAESCFPFGVDVESDSGLMDVDSAGSSGVMTFDVDNGEALAWLPFRRSCSWGNFLS